MKKENGVLTDVTDADIKLLETDPDKFWEGVTKIGEYAFFHCENLQNIKIPSSVTSIGEYAFRGCKSLQSIIIPNSITAISYGTFLDCKSLQNIEIPDSVKIIRDSAFENCESLQNIKIPSSLKRIHPRAFCGCGLQRVEIPDSVTEISHKTFYCCESLRSIKIPNSVTFIGIFAFFGCKSLQKAVIPDSVTTIAQGAFQGCENIQRVEIPDSVIKIYDEAFEDCESLRSIEIPSSVQEIGRRAFCGCKSLQRITIPSSVMAISALDFNRCESLQSINFQLPNGKEKTLDLKFASISNYDFTPSERNLNLIQQSYVPVLAFGLISDDMNLSAYKKLAKTYVEGDNSAKIEPLNLRDLISFGYNIGLFENSTMQVKTPSGKTQTVKVQDLAFNIIQKMTKNGIDIKDFHYHFQGFQKDEFNPAFLLFLNNKTNLSDIIEEEKRAPGFMKNVYDWFKDRLHMEGLGEVESSDSEIPTSEEHRYKVMVYETTPSGVDKLRWREPTVENLKHEFASRKYAGITQKTRPLAEYLSQFPQYSGQKYFDKAVEILEEFERSGVPEHLLGRELKQDKADAYREYLIKTGALREQILDEAGKAISLQTDSANKIFTYEMLSKSDYANLAMGLLTGCCATLFGAGSGAGRAMILSPDMQPMVIRDDKDNIIAFGILYINRAQQYAVFNDFEINRKYEYDDAARKAIYDKAMQGTRAFVREYNADNPDSPLKIVNCGLSPNWTAINDFIRENPQGDILKVPDFSEWAYVGGGRYKGDWQRSQFTLWKEGQSLEEEIQR